MFEDRKDAGQKLARALKNYKNKRPLVLAIPRGGVEVGCEVAKYLNAEFSILVSRKLPLPDDPEAGFGAVSEDGSTFIIGEYEGRLPRELVDRIILEQKSEIRRRIAILRKGRPLPEIKDRTVILVDDGIAMGSTMRASINLCRNKKAKKIIVAAPVSGRGTKEEMRRAADEIAILETPAFFRAVAQAYRHWHDVPNEEAAAILERYANHKGRDVL